MSGSKPTFEAICPGCEGRFAAQPEWVGLEVSCPHCTRSVRVPTPHPRGLPTLAHRAWEDPRAFCFPCPRCKCVLEAGLKQAGSPATCPSCAAQFRIPACDVSSGRIGPIEPDTSRELPAPIHAYAASGVQAPRIVGDGADARIECPRCRARNALDANACHGCGAPFSTEAVVHADDPAVASLSTISFVLGLISLPLCTLLLPAVAAALLGGYAIVRGQMSGHIPRFALLGTALGLVSGVVGALLVFG